MTGLLTINQPPINYSSQAGIATKQILLDPFQRLWILAASGAPTNGQGNGWAGPGSLAIDGTSGGIIYRQTGTLGATVWSTFGGVLSGNADNLTAHAGGGKASALALTKRNNRIATVATAADSVLLPPATAGAEIVIINDGVNSLQVFGQGTDTIDAVATGTGNAMAAAKRAIFYCVTAGAWQSLAGAKTS